MRVKQSGVVFAMTVMTSLAACGGGTEQPPQEATVVVRGAPLPYSDNRAANTPATIVFLHGAVTDLRMWGPHRAHIGSTYRTVAYTQRYHGTTDWAPNWPPYGVNTHAADLIAFLDQLGAGPVHLVAWSYAGHIAFSAALQRPDLFRGLFVYEPGVPSYVNDPAALNTLQQDGMAAFGPVFDAVRQGDNVAALKLLLDASGQATNYFDTQSAASRRIELDNARTMTELLLRQEAAPTITCAQLGSLQTPVRIAYGALSRPLYSVVSHAAQQCAGGSGHLVVPGHNHMWPDADPLGFTRAVIDFVEQR